MGWIEVLGWVAAAFTIATYAMKTMVPLRVLAILSSFCFLIYAALLPSWPMLVMELILLPFNIWRLGEILVKRRQITLAKTDADSVFALVRSIGNARRYRKDEVIFNRGDAPTYLYVIEEGEVHLDEIDVTVGPGEIFGEIAFFTDAKTRTATARCLTPCRIHAIDETTFLDLYFINPGFSLALMRLITRRLIDGVAKNPQLYRAPAKRPSDPVNTPSA